jgi:UDP-N-acetylglucosamine--N-acetylmuramyl-(pentapeptide) pyrophosphoryl-undecaprenol N-acetylglucosamine transferase
MRILVAAGGTGGHLYPALAVLRSLAAHRPDIEIRWIGGHRGLESSIVEREGFRLDLLWLRSLRSVDRSLHTVLDPVRLAASVPQAAAYLARWRPDVIYTTGGYVAMPVLAAAAPLRIPALMWEGNRIPGRSVRASARLADALAVSFPGTVGDLPGRAYVTGTPIRSFAGIDREGARARLELEDGVPVVLVFGGSQAVRRLNTAVARALPAVVSGVTLVHLTGDSGYAEALRNREVLPAELRHRYRPHPFLGDDMAHVLVAADLLVGRAGSSTLAEAAAVGLPMVVVPYPHAAAHQSANARELVEGGAAVLVRDEEFDAQALVDACAIPTDQARHGRMRDAAHARGRPNAAGATVAMLETLAERRTMPDPDRIDRLSRVVQ